MRCGEVHKYLAAEVVRGPVACINVFVVARYSGVPMEEVFAGVTPHVIAHFFAIALMIFFPAIVLWLPSTM